MLAVTAGAFLLVTWIATKGVFFFPSGVAHPLKAILRLVESLAQEHPCLLARIRSSIVTGWQCRRECVRHSALNVGRDNAIGAVQYLCTDEEKTPFQWLA